MTHLRTAAFLLLVLAASWASPGRAEDRRPDVFGYTAAFDEELKKIGPITPAQFVQRYPSRAEYLGRLGFDPTGARFFANFQKVVPPEQGGRGGYDFRLNPDELAAFQKNGFVASERMGAASFGQMYYRIYSRD